MQLLLTSFVSYECMYNKSINTWILSHSAAVMWPSFILGLILIFTLHCYKNKYPTNYYLLFAFTLSESLIVGLICAAYEASGQGGLVLQAVGITAAIFVGLSLFTFQSGYDFGFMGMYLFACLIGMIVWGFFISIFGFQTPYLYSLIGALLFCGYIVYDTWKISEKYTYDDYIPASIDLYLDIINLFLYILDLLSRRK
jgi:protein lifeguard